VDYEMYFVDQRRLICRSGVKIKESTLVLDLKLMGSQVCSISNQIWVQDHKTNV
jgi:hypothetical protein